MKISNVLINLALPFSFNAITNIHKYMSVYIEILILIIRTVSVWCICIISVFLITQFPSFNLASNLAST